MKKSILLILAIILVFPIFVGASNNKIKLRNHAYMGDYDGWYGAVSLPRDVLNVDEEYIYVLAQSSYDGLSIIKYNQSFDEISKSKPIINKSIYVINKSSISTVVKNQETVYYREYSFGGKIIVSHQIDVELTDDDYYEFVRSNNHFFLLNRSNGEFYIFSNDGELLNHLSNQDYKYHHLLIYQSKCYIVPYLVEDNVTFEFDYDGNYIGITDYVYPFSEFKYLEYTDGTYSYYYDRYGLRLYKNNEFIKSIDYGTVLDVNCADDYCAIYTTRNLIITDKDLNFIDHYETDDLSIAFSYLDNYYIYGFELVSDDPYNGSGHGYFININSYSYDAYNISKKILYGKGTIETNLGRARTGETITYKVTPDTGYAVNSITVKTVTGKDVEFKNNQFILPEEDVIVEVSFISKSILINPETGIWYYKIGNINIPIYTIILIIPLIGISIYLIIKKRLN